MEVRGRMRNRRLVVGMVITMWGCLLGMRVKPVLGQSNFPGFGPLPVRNFQPVQLLFLYLPFEGTTLTPQGHWALSFGLAESNTINETIDRAENTSLLFDLETTRFTLGARYGVLPRVELGVEIPFIARWGGFLDRFIEGVERVVNKLNPARKRGPVNTVRFHLQRNGELIFSRGESALGISDLVLSGKGLLWEEGETYPALAARLQIKLPTGDEERLLGSGKTDIGVGLVAQKTLWRFTLYSNLNYIMPGEVFAGKGLETRNFFTAALGIEYRWTSHFSLLGQAEYYQSPFTDTGLEELDQSLWEISFGFNWALGSHLLWQLGGIQNLVVAPAADFSFQSHLVYQF
ncbi:MAG: DUF3187 family protein [Nitrospinota bacterium]|nr:MAG: DUF3187 family protein [Nitrospinota bacterium]